jgi:hypothetical protein
VRPAVKALVDYAEANGYTSAQVASASFSTICTHLNIDPSNVPEDFFYRGVRQAAVTELARREKAASDETIRLAARAKLRELIQLADVEVTKTEDGWLITKE